MSLFLSHIHAEIRRSRITRRGSTLAPKDVPQGQHKAYPRMPAIELPEPSPTGMSLDAALTARRSKRSASAGDQLTASDWGTLLGHTLRTQTQSMNRNYPSGGRLFPIETYLMSSGIEQFGPSVFHYNPTLHILERLWQLPHGFDIKQLAKKPDDLQFSSLIVFTSVWDRSGAKYGDLSYSHAMLEAGHMSENVLLVATALGLHTCPMAGFNDGLLIELLDLNEELEQPVHTITVSKQSSQGGVGSAIVE